MGFALLYIAILMPIYPGDGVFRKMGGNRPKDRYGSIGEFDSINGASEARRRPMQR